MEDSWFLYLHFDKKKFWQSVYNGQEDPAKKTRRDRTRLHKETNKQNRQKRQKEGKKESERENGRIRIDNNQYDRQTESLKETKEKQETRNNKSASLSRRIRDQSIIVRGGTRTSGWGKERGGDICS